MLDLCECNVVEELDKKLTGDVGLVTGESFDCNEDSRGGNDESVEGVNPRHQEESNLDGLRVGRECVGRFVSGRGQEVGHGVGEGLVERR